MNHINYCKLCGKKGEYKCSKCGRVTYCSRECQFKDWINHKNNCINFKSKNQKNSPISLNKKINYSNNNNQKEKIIINNNKNDLNFNESGKKKIKQNIQIYILIIIEIEIII